MKKRKFDGVWLKEFLEEKVLVYNHPRFIEEDPISIVHKFSDKRDIELIGLLMATIAWGNRKSILKSGENILKILNYSPYEFIINFNTKDEKAVLQSSFVHRTFNAEDLLFFCKALQQVIKEYESLENLFVKGFQQESENAGAAICFFRTEMLKLKHQQRQTKHISDPAANSAAKRLNMFLRWMIRNDNRGVDFGIWKQISPSKLSIPLDIHTGSTARELGLLRRQANDGKAVGELDANLRIFDSLDPVKYDFALFGLGVYGWEEMK
jgi:uncharacterized protein (TIGR02757 family)